ncbi:hypothetical protein DUNSADRAFT_14159 [Dunaliella salina]|uniref:Uncharacterized protein n=1 Tax=Dunaliella salina TaxID=3046 RepID=A0ABQ7H2S5_DUNSA|nr:hypothetical protein DUNSADRAFT_14159 [Dunaliella salina]|eukprot:KAF5841157.1 hypothetical protein DUNSADRAFT_14159 [Dunaliella salina]
MTAPHCTALQSSTKAVKGACLQRTWRPRAADALKYLPSNSSCSPSRLQVCSSHHPDQDVGSRTPAAKAAIFTGTYATVAGLALTMSPVTVFGLLFDATAVPRGWIRVGGILFALIGMQYLGAGLRDGRMPPPSPQKESPSSDAHDASENERTGSGKSPQAPVGRPVAYSRSFYEASIWSRLFLACGFAVLVAAQESQLTLLVLAALNLAGALSMLSAVRRTDKALNLAADNKQSRLSS